mgnify:CR=1 FL=1
MTSLAAAAGRWTNQTTTSTTQTEEDSTSQKGIKGENTYAINGGTFTIDSADDCFIREEKWRLPRESLP